MAMRNDVTVTMKSGIKHVFEQIHSFGMDVDFAIIVLHTNKGKETIRIPTTNIEIVEELSHDV